MTKCCFHVITVTCDDYLNVIFDHFAVSAVSVLIIRPEYIFISAKTRQPGKFPPPTRIRVQPKITNSYNISQILTITHKLTQFLTNSQKFSKILTIYHKFSEILTNSHKFLTNFSQILTISNKFLTNSHNISQFLTYFTHFSLQQPSEDRSVWEWA